MILVTRLDRQVMLLNPDHIISIEETPDTVITLFNGHHILVRERAQVLLNRIVSYKTTVIRRAGSVGKRPGYLKRNRLQLFSNASCGVFDHSKNGTWDSPLHHQDI